MTAPTPPSVPPSAPRPRRRTAWALVLLASAAPATVAAWALWPLGPVAVNPPELAEPPPAADRNPLPLDLAAFHAPLWVAPAPQPPPPKPPDDPSAAARAEPPPPIRLQLLAIVREDGPNGRSIALVYDPERDTLLVLREGDQHGTCRVARVTPASLELLNEAGVRTLALRDPGARP